MFGKEIEKINIKTKLITIPSTMKFKQEYQLNPKNNPISRDQVESIINGVFYRTNCKVAQKGSEQKFIEFIKIHNIEHYIKAFTHESYVGEQNYLKDNPPSDEELKKIKNDPFLLKLLHYVPSSSNERLEFLGDAVIDNIVVDYLYHRYPDQRENFMTKLKIRLVKTEMLSYFAEQLEFGKYLLLSSFHESLEKKGQGRNNPKILENAFEAFIGAITEDYTAIGQRGKGYEICYNFVSGVIELFVDIQQLILHNDNFKDSMLRYFQSIKSKPPVFHQVYSEGPPNDRTFTMTILIDELFFNSLNSDIRLQITKYQKNIHTTLNNKKIQTQAQLKDYETSSVQENQVLDDLQDQDQDQKFDHGQDCWKRGCKPCGYKQVIKGIDELFLSLNTYYIIGYGTGMSKKKAEQSSSKEALQSLNVDLNF